MSTFKASRRSFIATASVTAFGGVAMSSCDAMNLMQSRVRQITHGPKHHWFGYYDKLQFDPTSRFVLGMQVDFEHRSPKADDQIEIGMVDLEKGNRWVKLGKSNAWCWQQGCMLQWLPGSLHEVIWNDREDGTFVSRIMNVVTGKMRSLPHPVYSVSPNGKYAVAPDFRRINDVRPGYGYAGLAEKKQNKIFKNYQIYLNQQVLKFIDQRIYLCRLKAQDNGNQSFHILLYVLVTII